MGLFSKGTNPIHGGATLTTYSPPKGPPPSATILGVSLSMGGGGHKHNSGHMLSREGRAIVQTGQEDG